MPEPRTAEPNSTDDRARVANVLVENHRAFLRFLERRAGDRAVSEDLLQDAFARNLDRLSDVPDEGLIPGFYRVLRNAAIDGHRRSGAEERALTAFAQAPVKAFAEAAGLSASNAGVRLFRAREALRKQLAASCGTCAEHGCIDCSCGKP